MEAGPRVELLYFDGCPNHERARAAVERVAADVGVEVDIRLVQVEGPDDAHRLRFLGSPTVRVAGRDVEPGADERTDSAYSCRVYRTPAGLAGEPDEAWIRDALTGAGRTAGAP